MWSAPLPLMLRLGGHGGRQHRKPHDPPLVEGKGRMLAGARGFARQHGLLVRPDSTKLLARQPRDPPTNRRRRQPRRAKRPPPDANASSGPFRLRSILAVG